MIFELFDPHRLLFSDTVLGPVYETKCQSGIVTVPVPYFSNKLISSGRSFPHRCPNNFLRIHYPLTRTVKKINIFKYLRKKY